MPSQTNVQHIPVDMLPLSPAAVWPRRLCGRLVGLEGMAWPIHLGNRKEGCPAADTLLLEKRRNTWNASAKLVPFGSDPKHPVTRKQAKKAAGHPYHIILLVVKISSW